MLLYYWEDENYTQIEFTAKISAKHQKYTQ